MRIIKENYLQTAAKRYPKAAKYLAAWVAIVRAATWKNLAEVQSCYGSADFVRVTSGNSVVVFNVCGNTYRLIAAIHFNTQIVYILRFLTHAEYSCDDWKKDL